MFLIEMVEGKDHPSQLSELFSEAGKTGGLLLRMLQCYFATGHYVVLDGGFYVLRAIVALKKHGVFAGALIKMRWYWLTLLGTQFRVFLMVRTSGWVRFSWHLWQSQWRGLFLVGNEGTGLCDEDDGHRRAAACNPTVPRGETEVDK
jgi:hypothetical protein